MCTCTFLIFLSALLPSPSLLVLTTPCKPVTVVPFGASCVLASCAVVSKTGSQVPESNMWDVYRSLAIYMERATDRGARSRASRGTRIKGATFFNVIYFSGMLATLRDPEVMTEKMMRKTSTLTCPIFTILVAIMTVETFLWCTNSFKHVENDSLGRPGSSLDPSACAATVFARGDVQAGPR